MKKRTITIPEFILRPIGWILYGLAIALVGIICTVAVIAVIYAFAFSIHLIKLYGWYAGVPILIVVLCFLGYLVEDAYTKSLYR